MHHVFDLRCIKIPVTFILEYHPSQLHTTLWFYLNADLLFKICVFTVKLPSVTQRKPFDKATRIAFCQKTKQNKTKQNKLKQNKNKTNKNKTKTKQKQKQIKKNRAQIIFLL